MAEKLTSLEMDYILVQRQVEFGNMLLELNQPGAATDYQNLAQVAATYPGGRLVSYAKQLLADSKAGNNPYHGFAPPSVPSGEVSTLGDEKLLQVEEAGVREARKAAFVLVAGGLKDCLSYNGIKVALPGESTTVTCFLRQYIVSYNLVLQDPDCWINPDDYNVYMPANDSFLESLKVRMMDYRFLVRRGLFNYLKGVYKREEDTYVAMGLPRDLKKPGDSLTYRYLLSTFFGL